MNKLKIGIVGHGFVGKAVEYGFTTPHTEFFIVDPKYGTTIDDLVKWDPATVFICAPTPMKKNGRVDATIVEDAVLKIARLSKAGIILKSTVTPDIIERILNTLVEDELPLPEDKEIPDILNRFCYNPEFLTEKNANDQFVNPEFLILGGHGNAVGGVLSLYYQYSNINDMEGKVFNMTAMEAAWTKYAINAFLATKVTFFNNLYDAMYGKANYNVVVRALSADSRIGPSHTKVPGFDMKRGFGGACLPKDISAITHIAELPLLEEVIRINNEYRAVYAKDDREEANNVNYGQIKEEQQDQVNGSVEREQVLQ